MPKMNIDEQTSLFEPIEFTLEGKDYIIAKVTTDMMEKVTADDAKSDLLKQFSILTGANIEDLKAIDIRKIGAALKFVTESILEGQRKNG